MKWSLALSLLVALSATAAVAGNPVVNGHFHVDIAGWGVPPGFVSTAPSRSLLDANAAPTSGSLRLRNIAVGSATARLVQCVPSTADFWAPSIRYRLPSGQGSPASGFTKTYTPYASGDCSGSPLSLFSVGVLFAATNQWIEHTNSFTTPAGTHSLLLGFNVAVTGGTGGFDLLLDDVFLIPNACDATTLCLRDDRFALVADWRTDTGSAGQAGVVQLTPETGYFWFFTPSNVELVSKLLNGCPLATPRYWVFTAGLTNQQVVLLVLDKARRVTRVYANPQGTDFAPRYDTDAFATCP
jgi:hypothetical protein